MSYECQTCGKQFASVEDAHMAALYGCPDCGCVNITEIPICEGIIYKRCG